MHKPCEGYHVSLTPLTLEVQVYEVDAGRGRQVAAGEPQTVTLSPLATVLSACNEMALALDGAVDGQNSSPHSPFQGWGLYRLIPDTDRDKDADESYGHLDYEATLAAAGVTTHTSLAFLCRRVVVPVRIGPNGPLVSVPIDEAWSVYEIVDEIAAAHDSVLHPEEYSFCKADGHWLVGSLSLPAQRAWSSLQTWPDAPAELVLTRKLYFIEAHAEALANLGPDAPDATLHLLYREASHLVTSGALPVTEKEAILLAGLALQIAHGPRANAPPDALPQEPKDLACFLPPELAADVGAKLARKIARKHATFATTPRGLALSKYIKLVRSNPNYGWTFWPMKERVKAGRRFRLVPRLLGLSGSGLKILNAKRSRELVVAAWLVIESVSGSDVGLGPSVVFNINNPSYADEPLVIVVESDAHVRDIIGFCNDYVQLATRRSLASELVLTSCASLASLSQPSWDALVEPTSRRDADSERSEPDLEANHALPTHFTLNRLRGLDHAGSSSSVARSSSLSSLPAYVSEQWDSLLVAPQVDAYTSTTSLFTTEFTTGSEEEGVLGRALQLQNAASASTFFTSGMYFLPLLDDAPPTMEKLRLSAKASLAAALKPFSDLAATGKAALASGVSDGDEPSPSHALLVMAASGELARDALASLALALLELVMAAAGDTTNLLLPEAAAASAELAFDALHELVARLAAFAGVAHLVRSQLPDADGAYAELWVPASQASGWRVPGELMQATELLEAASAAVCSVVADARAVLIAASHALHHMEELAPEAPPSRANTAAGAVVADAIAIPEEQTSALLTSGKRAGSAIARLATLLGVSPLAADLVDELDTQAQASSAAALALTNATAHDAFATLARTRASSLRVELNALPDLTRMLQRSVGIVSAAIKLGPVHHVVAAKIKVASAVVSSTVRSLPHELPVNVPPLREAIISSLSAYQAAVDDVRPKVQPLTLTARDACLALINASAAVLAELPRLDGDAAALRKASLAVAGALASVGHCLRNAITILDSNGSHLVLLKQLSAVSRLLVTANGLASQPAPPADQMSEVLVRASALGRWLHLDCDYVLATHDLKETLAGSLVTAARLVVAEQAESDMHMTLGRDVSELRSDLARLALAPRSMRAADALFSNVSRYVAHASAVVAAAAGAPTAELTAFSDSLARLAVLQQAAVQHSMAAMIAMYISDIDAARNRVCDALPSDEALDEPQTAGGEGSPTSGDMPAFSDSCSSDAFFASGSVADLLEALAEAEPGVDVHDDDELLGSSTASLGAQADALVADIDSLLDQLGVESLAEAMDDDSVAISGSGTRASVAALERELAQSSSLAEAVGHYNATVSSLEASGAAVYAAARHVASLPNARARASYAARAAMDIHSAVVDARLLVATVMAMWPKIYSQQAVARLKNVTLRFLSALGALLAVVRDLVSAVDGHVEERIAECKAAMATLKTAPPGLGMLSVLADELSEALDELRNPGVASSDTSDDGARSLDDIVDVAEQAVDAALRDGPGSIPRAHGGGGEQLGKTTAEQGFSELEAILRKCARLVTATLDELVTRPETSLNDVEAGAQLVAQVMRALTTCVVGLRGTIQLAQEAPALRASLAALVSKVRTKVDDARAHVLAGKGGLPGESVRDNAGPWMAAFDEFFAAFDAAVLAAQGSSGQTGLDVQRAVETATAGAARLEMSELGETERASDKRVASELRSVLDSSETMQATLNGMMPLVSWQGEASARSGTWPGLDGKVPELAVQSAIALANWVEGTVRCVEVLGGVPAGVAPTPPSSPAGAQAPAPAVVPTRPVWEAISSEFKAVMVALTTLKELADTPGAVARNVRAGYTQLVLAVRDILLVLKEGVVTDVAEPGWLVKSEGEAKMLRKAGSALKTAAMKVVKHCDTQLKALRPTQPVAGVLKAKAFRKAFKATVSKLLAVKTAAEEIECVPAVSRGRLGGRGRAVPAFTSVTQVGERLLASGGQASWVLDLSGDEVAALCELVCDGRVLARLGRGAALAVVDALASLKTLAEPVDAVVSVATACAALEHACDMVDAVRGSVALLSPTTVGALEVLVQARQLLRAIEDATSASKTNAGAQLDAMMSAAADAFLAEIDRVDDALGGYAEVVASGSMGVNFVAARAEVCEALGSVADVLGSGVCASRAQLRALSRELSTLVRDGVVPLVSCVLSSPLCADKECVSKAQAKSGEAICQVRKVFEADALALLDAHAWRSSLIATMGKYVGDASEVDSSVVLPGLGYSDYVRKTKSHVVESVQAAQSLIDAAKCEQGRLGVAARTLVEATEGVLKCVCGALSQTPASASDVLDAVRKASKTLAWTVARLVETCVDLAEASKADRASDAGRAAVISTSQRLVDAVSSLMCELKAGAVDAQRQRAALDASAALGSQLKQTRLVLQSRSSGSASAGASEALGAAAEDALMIFLEEGVVETLGRAETEASVADALENAAKQLATAVAQLVELANAVETDVGSGVCKAGVEVVTAFCAAGADAAAHCGARQSSKRDAKLVSAVSSRVMALVRAVRAASEAASRMSSEVTALAARVSSDVEALAELAALDDDGDEWCDAAAREQGAARVGAALRGLLDAIGQVWLGGASRSRASVLAAGHHVASRVEGVVSAMRASAAALGRDWVLLSGEVWQAAEEAHEVVERLLESEVAASAAETAWAAVVSAMIVAASASRLDGPGDASMAAVSVMEACAENVAGVSGDSEMSNLAHGAVGAVVMLTKVALLGLAEAEGLGFADGATREELAGCVRGVASALESLAFVAVASGETEEAGQAYSEAVNRVSAAVVKLISANNELVARGGACARR
ncbi:uncharacterized protein AMSG_06353 [Thecamonas trahens ATCC 50062]|uniref:FERM domain-containing protein n=1 Tax=Thecamonas trahens ATCC 50062 TaxID=461836 RepID=A0A0L0DFV4_THETB|nr:hypothetical protein AMSG_06353 [Thecamonas trahens ATCC 50062]KNC50208.1 hypothetical protein AMSG_06353 [Thecamonas trahens ATCC 50062]|eukprot:XP_013757043.1 hypothetical protein AMSG_06353 [Thecamonas trahens ATCC 50062]